MILLQLLRVEYNALRYFRYQGSPPPFHSPELMAALAVPDKQPTGLPLAWRVVSRNAARKSVQCEPSNHWRLTSQVTLTTRNSYDTVGTVTQLHESVFSLRRRVQTDGGNPQPPVQWVSRVIPLR